MKKHSYLCLTSGLFLIPLYIYALKRHKKMGQHLLAFILLLCFIFSQLFWYHPVQHSLIHKVDALIAKITILLFALYTLFYKKLCLLSLVFYFLLGLLALCAFYRSNFFSTREWSCNDHLLNHGLLHISGFFAFLYVFI